MKLAGEWRELMGRLLAPEALGPARFRTLLAVIVILAGVIRLLAIGAPALDRTYWKEIDYIAISSNYREHGFRFHRPEISWPAEEPRVTAMEFPLVPYIAALGYVPLGVNPFSVRWLTLAAFLVGTVYLARLARREIGPLAGVLSGLSFALLPLTNPFGRILYSEPFMIALAVVGVYYWAEWLDSREKRDWWLAVAGFTLAVAVKAEPLYLLLPVSWLAVRKLGLGVRAAGEVARFAAVSLLLPVAWYAYAYHLGKTSIDVFGVFGGHNKLQSFTMLSDPEWYRTMASRIGEEILGGRLGVLLAILGIGVAIVVRGASVFAAWLVAIGIYFCIVAEGNLDAPYRQLHLLPAIAPFVALGAIGAVAALGVFVRPLRSAAPTGILAACLLGIALIPRSAAALMPDARAPASNGTWALAQALRPHAPPGTRIVTLGEYTVHEGGNDLSPLLYHYAGVTGWSLQRPEWDTLVVDRLRERGAAFLVGRNLERERGLAEFAGVLAQRYPVLQRDTAAHMLVLDLRTPSSLPRSAR